MAACRQVRISSRPARAQLERSIVRSYRAWLDRAWRALLDGSSDEQTCACERALGLTLWRPAIFAPTLHGSHNPESLDLVGGALAATDQSRIELCLANVISSKLGDCRAWVWQGMSRAGSHAGRGFIYCGARDAGSTSGGRVEFLRKIINSRACWLGRMAWLGSRPFSIMIAREK